jgi:hypothetical protein
LGSLGADSNHITFTLNHAHRKAVYREYVGDFHCLGIVPAKHVLIPQKVAEVCAQSTPYALVGLAIDDSRKGLQGRKLPAVEQLAISSIAEPKETFSLLASRNPVVWHKTWFHMIPVQRSGFVDGKITRVGFLEVASSALRSAANAVILHREQPMVVGLLSPFGVSIGGPTVRAIAFMISCRPLKSETGIA